MPFILLFGLLLGAIPDAGASEEQTDRALQRGEQVAQVVQGILSYARWPHEPQQLRLCVIAPTQYADILLGSSAEKSQRPVHSMRRLVDDAQLESACEAIYLGIMADNDRRELLGRLVGKPILTISETSDPCSEGSLFCLRVRDEQVSFEINLDTVARSGIRVHPKVLQLGKRQRGRP